MENSSFFEKLIDAALANGISIRENKWKLVFVFSDDCDEMYFNFNDPDIKKKIESEGESGAVKKIIDQFMAMDK